MTELFIGSEQKVIRAKRHLAELAAEVTMFLATRPFRVIVEEPPDATAKNLRFHIWTVRMREPTPDHLPAVVGDAIHNLRSALDLMACDVVRHNGKGVSGVYFPFAADAIDLEKQIKDKNLRRASPEAVSLIRSLKPYRGGNIDLRGLHDLDVQDKHKGPIALISAVTTPPVGLKLGNHVNQIPQWNTTVQDGFWLMMVPAMSNLPVGSEIPSAFRFVFAQNTPFSGHEVVPTLHRLAEHVSGIVQAFKTLCLGNESGRAA